MWCGGGEAGLALAIVIACATALGLTKCGPKRFRHRREQTGVAGGRSSAYDITGELQNHAGAEGGGRAGGWQGVVALPVVDARVVPDDDYGGAGSKGQRLMGGVTEFSDLRP